MIGLATVEESQIACTKASMNTPSNSILFTAHKSIQIYNWFPNSSVFILTVALPMLHVLYQGNFKHQWPLRLHNWVYTTSQKLITVFISEYQQSILYMTWKGWLWGRADYYKTLLCLESIHCPHKSYAKVLVGSLRKFCSIRLCTTHTASSLQNYSFLICMCEKILITLTLCDGFKFCNNIGTIF